MLEVLRALLSNELPPRCGRWCWSVCTIDVQGCHRLLLSACAVLTVHVEGAARCGCCTLWAQCSGCACSQGGQMLSSHVLGLSVTMGHPTAPRMAAAGAGGAAGMKALRAARFTSCLQQWDTRLNATAVPLMSLQHH